MEISKSTPYVRYRENISSTLHKGTIHIESEYLDRERKTTIESIEGQTWQNMVNGENKEEDILPRLGLKIEGNEDVLDTVEQHMPIDTIIGDVEPVANADGTYTYEISTMEGSYAKTLDGENNFSLTSDGLIGDMYIKYNAQGGEVNGNIVMNNGQSSYTIENSNNGEIKSAILTGNTLVNLSLFKDTALNVKGVREKKCYNKDIIKPNTKYLISYNVVAVSGETVMKIDGMNVDSFPTELGKHKMIVRTISNLTTSFANNLWITGNSNSIEIDDFLIIEYQDGMENWDIPYFEGMQSVKMPVLTTIGKNLYNPDTAYVHRGFDVKNDVDVKPNTEYTFYANNYPWTQAILYNNKGQETRHYGNSSTSTKVTFTTTNDDVKAELVFYHGDGTVIENVDFTGVQLEYGAVSTSYEPYKSNILTVNEDVTLRSNGGICDELNLLTGQLTQRIDEDGEVLSQEVVKTVDLTIKDQNDKIIQTLHTYPSTTHINLSSDGLIPSAELSYTMYGNIGETTGEKITNGTDSKLIEGKIYGDTLLNVLPSPSLKNSMDYNTSIQKLNNGYDNINVVDGEFKKATLYGQTLVNIQEKGSWNINNDGENASYSSRLPTSLLKPSTKYFVKFNKDISTICKQFYFIQSTSIMFSLTSNSTGSYGIVTTKSDIDSITNPIHIYPTDGTALTLEQLTDLQVMIIEYVDGMENWNIPYFEGMQSVNMPVLTTSNEDDTKSNTLSTPEDVTLRAVGNVRDELDCVTGEVTQRIGEVVLDGSEDWTRDAVNQDVQTNTMMFEVNLPDMKILTKSENLLDTVLKCDKMSVKSSDYLWTNDVEGVSKGLNLKTVRIRISKNKLSTQDINGLKQYLQSNPITVQYELETSTVKTVDISITDQDNQPQTALHTIANGYISTSSQGLLPKVDYEVPTSNSYYLDMVKPNTQYTTKSSSDCNATIDGVVYPLSANGTFTTPSTITDNLMVLDTPVEDLMFIEGDLTGRELDYFTGLQSVEMPILTIIGNNLWDGKWYEGFSNDGGGGKPAKLNNLRNTYRTNYIKIPKNSDKVYTHRFCEASNFTSYSIHIGFFDKDKQRLNVEGNASPASFNIPINAEYFVIHVWNSVSYDFTTLKINVNIAPINETSYKPHQSSILTTNEPIALHKIGDVKDELDLVNECVVRRIGKVILDGSDDEKWVFGGTNSYGMTYFNYDVISNNIVGNSIPVLCDKFNYINNGIHTREKECIGIVANSIRLVIKVDRLSSVDITGFKQWLSENPITVLYELATPTTEPVRIVPQNPKQSTVSLTLQSPLQKVGNVADQLRWNPYKGHYVRYNYIQDGVANSTYTFEDLKDMNERKNVNLYNQRTYIDTDHTVQVISHGLSRYCLTEQGKQYQVRWDWMEQPSVDTIKVDLCGNVKEIPSSDNSVIIDIEKFIHQFIQIQGLGLTGKITNLMVIETVNSEIPDVDFFSGIQCIGNTVTIDGNTKVQIDMEQTNGNLIDEEFYVYNNGNALMFNNSSRLNIKPNKSYTYKIYKNKNDYVYTAYVQFFDKNNNQTRILNCGAVNNEINITELYSNYNETMIRLYTSNIKNDGSIHTYYPFELCYADMAKDGIRPRYYDKESIILPMKLCRVGNIYDNLYYDDLKGYYRIQQSIGHKYFTGETTEVWTMETTNGYRTIKFTCTSANIDQIALGQTICNSFKHLSTINDDIEGFIIYNGNFVLRIDKDRLVDKTVDGFKALLASSPIHLFYQLKTPQMINLTEYPNRIEFNTYRDEIFTFFKGMNPTKFTLSVPMDKTYRYEIEEEGQGLANRVVVNNETISAENVVAVKEIRGQGIANIIEDVNNVVITPRPNHGGIATSHTLNNTKPAIIRIHGFEPSGDTAIGTYNTTDKAYQLKVMSSNGDNSLSDYYVLNVPYKLETYTDGTKDMVYYDEAYKQWHFKGLSVKEYTVASDGTLNEVVEVFRGLTPRSGMIAEFKLMFTSGTTSSRMYYSLNGTTYNYTSLRNMSDGNYLYVGIFNTGGTKIDIAYKTDPNAEYTNLSPLSTQVPECFMVNQIQSCTFCEVTLDKQYIYSEMNIPIELDTYDGTTKVFMDGNATDTNIIIRNECTTKIVNTYTDTDYTVYWKYVDGLGNLRITLGGTSVEVDGKQEYATIKTQLNAPQELLYIGGYNLSIKDLMVVKGAKIDDLPYFEGSRQVGTLVLDGEGNKSYKITLVQGGSVLGQRDENTIAFKDDNKHNVVVHKIVGVCPTKVD